MFGSHATHPALPLWSLKTRAMRRIPSEGSTEHAVVVPVFEWRCRRGARGASAGAFYQPTTNTPTVSPHVATSTPARCLRPPYRPPRRAPAAAVIVRRPPSSSSSPRPAPDPSASFRPQRWTTSRRRSYNNEFKSSGIFSNTRSPFKFSIFDKKTSHRRV